MQSIRNIVYVIFRRRFNRFANLAKGCEVYHCIYVAFHNNVSYKCFATEIAHNQLSARNGVGETR